MPKLPKNQKAPLRFPAWTVDIGIIGIALTVLLGDASLMDHNTLGFVVYVVLAGAVLCVAIFKHYKWSVRIKLSVCAVVALVVLYPVLSRFSEDTTPAIEVHQFEVIDGTIVDPPNLKGRMMGIILMGLSNRGPDTVLQDWRVEIKQPGTDAYIDCEVNTLSLSRFRLFGATEVHLSDVDALDRKTYPDPIKHGAGATGFLAFFPTKPIQSSTNLHGWMLRIHCRNAFGGSYTWEALLNRETNSSTYLPGLHTDK